MMTENQSSYKTLQRGSAVELKKLKKQIYSLQRLVNGRDSHKLPEGKKELLKDKLQEAQKNVRSIKLILFRNRAIWAFKNKMPRSTISKKPLPEPEVMFIYYNSIISFSVGRHWEGSEMSEKRLHSLEELSNWNRGYA